MSVRVFDGDQWIGGSDDEQDEGTPVVHLLPGAGDLTDEQIAYQLGRIEGRLDCCLQLVQSCAETLDRMLGDE